MKNNLFKKSIAIVMTVMMLMTCWVFVPGEHNHAEAVSGTVYGVPAINGAHYSGTTNAYGTPVFDGNTDRWFLWQNGDDWTKIYYPSQIYLDKSESLQAAGYYFNVQWHFGDGAKYRTFLGANIWGDHSQWSGYPERYYTMNNIFSNYAVDASLPDGYDGDGGLYGKNTGSSANYDLRIVGYNHSGQGTDQFSYNDTTHTKYISLRSRKTTNNATIYLMGNPNASYVGKTTEYNTSGNSFGGYGYAQKDGSTHKNGSNVYAGKGDDSSYREGDWIEMQWFVTVYDKSALNTLINTAITMRDNAAKYDRASRAALDSAITTAQAVLTKRATNQTEIDNAKAALQTVVNAAKIRTYELTYENLFSLSDWWNSQSANKSGVSVDLAAGKVTVKNTNASGEYVTPHSNGGTTANTRNTANYAMPVTEGKSYTLKYKTDHADTQMFAFFYAANGACVYEGGSYGVYNFSAKNGSGEATFTAPAGAAYMEIRFDNNTPASTANYWDVMVYEADRAAEVGLSDWLTRPYRVVYNYGDTITASGIPSVERPGYIFDNWYFKDYDGVTIDQRYGYSFTGDIAASYVLYSKWTAKGMDVGYDNLFSVAEWALAAGNNTTNRGGKITVDYDNGTISIENPAGADNDNNYVPWNYDITVKKNTDYVFVYNADYEGGGVQVHLFLNNGKDVSGSWGTFPNDCYIYEGTPSKVVTFNTGDYDNINVRLGTVNANGITNTFSNIGLYEKAAYDAYAKDYAKVREAFKVGDVKDFFKPTREGYSFEGWELADGTKITSTEGLTSSTTVYAVWAKLYKVTYYYDNGEVLETDTVKEGATVSSLPKTKPTKESTAEHEYEFDYWLANNEKFDADTIITSDLRVEPVFKEKEHESFRFSHKSDATCLENAKVKKYCQDCGYYFGEVTYNPDEDVEANKHESWIAVGSHDFSGSISRDEDENATVHYVGCTRCDAKDAVAHSYDQQQTTNTFKKEDASCTSSAVYYYSCVCGAKGTETFTYGASAGHKEVTVEGYAATCTETGLTAGKKCSVCGVTTVAQEEIPKLGHLDENKDHICDRGCSIAQGTCSDSATDGDHKCDYGCGKVLEDCSDKANDGNHKCDICGKDNVTDHIKGTETKENIEEATCGSAGKYDSVYYCTECNTVMERTNDVTIAQKPHNWQAATYSWTAGGKTCTATRTCANNAAHTESETVNATGVQTVAPTCEDKGATLYTADFEADWAVTQTNEVYDISANGHTPAAAVIENNTPATCTKDGSYDTVIYCSVEGCNNQISRVTTTVTATGHTAGAVVVENEVDATCTTGGSYDNVTYCTVCGTQTSRETIPVSQKGHTAGAVVVENNVPATCTKDGSYDNVTYCTVCGVQTSRETITVPQKGHTAGAVVVENNVPVNKSKRS